MNHSILKIGSAFLMLWFTLLSHANPVPHWSIISVKKAPCLLWDKFGYCAQMLSSHQYFPDFNSLMSTFQIFTDSVKDLDKRVFALESKSNPPMTSNSNEIPQWSLESVKDAPCQLWDEKGHCMNRYTNYQYFPDFENTVHVLQTYTNSVNGLDKRIAVLEGKANPSINPGSSDVPQWTLVSIKDTPCLFWGNLAGNISCLKWYSSHRYFPDFNSTAAVLHLINNSMNGLDDRISALESKR